MTKRKLSISDVEQIRKRFKSGEKQTAFAKEYLVNVSTISKCISARESWKPEIKQEKTNQIKESGGWKRYYTKSGTREIREHLDCQEMNIILNVWLKNRYESQA